MTVRDRITRARTQLLIKQPWFGVLALKLEPVEMPSSMAAQMPTMATDGTRLYYHPPFVEKLTDPELEGIVAHEVLHCALLHPYRRFTRHPLKWNIAVDFVVNLILKQNNFTLPAGCLHDNAWKDMSSEQVYAQLKNYEKIKFVNVGVCMDAPGTGDPKGDGKDQQSKCGTEGGTDNTPQDWEIAVAQAEAVAKQAGKFPGGLTETLSNLRAGKVDWRAYLQQFIQSTLPTDYSWLRPRKALMSRGLYMPGMKKENVGPIVIITDTSGSVFDPETQREFASEINSILLSIKPEKVIVLYVDTEVQKVQEFLPSEGEFEFIIKGGGGTLFAPGFKWIEENLSEPPVCGIYLTDLENADGNPPDPGFPFLWVVPERIKGKGPFGETLQIPSEAKG